MPFDDRTQTQRMITMMRSFIHHGRSEPARWWRVVWGFSVDQSVYSAATRHDCRDALAPGLGLIAPTHGILKLKGNRKGQYINICVSILRSAGLDGSDLQYVAEQGRVVISKV